jgi:small subunit ribosomal protein S4
MLKKPTNGQKIKSSKRFNCNIYSLQGKLELNKRPTSIIGTSLLRHFYGNISGLQFNRYLRKAKSINQFLQSLELRLDVVLFRVMFTNSIFTSKQLINHGHVLVNGKKIDRPSFKIKLGDFIQINPQIINKMICVPSQERKFIIRNKNNLLPIKNWEINWKLLSATLVSPPNQDNIYYPIPINLDELITPHGRTRR